jgi:peptidyl-prolyl cis-trans isomerase SurA
MKIRCSIDPVLIGISIAVASLTHASRLEAARDIVQLDRIIAVVNDEVITRNDLDRRIAMVVKQLESRKTEVPPSNVLEKQLLERMINDRAQLQYAKETGIRVEDAQLEKTLLRIAQENKMTLAAFREALEKDGIKFSQFREEIRNEIILARVKEREVDSKMVVAESEIDNFLNTMQAQKSQSLEYRIGHILVRLPEGANAEETAEKQARAAEAAEKLRAGEDFAQVSAQYSEAPEANEGGEMGWRTADRLPTMFVEAVQPLKINGVTPVLKSANGFHVLKLLDKRGAGGPASIQQTHTRHILIKVSELTPEADAKHRLVELKERLDNGADFAELARLHSEDPSASEGGDIGWIAPGDTVPEFERAMKALEPGQVSDPVQTPFGWHLIQLLDRRTDDVGQDRQRLYARQQLRTRKSDEAYQEWVRQLRDRAYVEIRLDDEL